MSFRIDTDRLRRDISQILSGAAQTVRTGEVVSDALYWTTRNHVQVRYPGSTHWALEKITKGQSTTNQGSVNVDVAGASRAYHDVTILPRWKRALTIPIHSIAYGKSVKDFEGLFRPKNKNILAKVVNGQLVPIFALVKRAFQPQDSTLLPTDSTFAHNICARWMNALERGFKGNFTNRQHNTEAMTEQ